jgi:hypothetical protein
MNDNTASDSKAPRIARTTVGLVAIAGVALAVAMLVGIGDNPPGLALLYLSVVLFITAIVHTWRRPKCFFWLFLGSLIGFPVFAILHNVLYALGELTKETPVLPWIFEGLHVAGFLIAIVLCPAGAIVGLVGFIITTVRTRRKRATNELE